MKLMINAASIFKGGAEQVVNSFINECRSYTENEYHILLCDNIYKQLEINSFSSNFHFYKIKARPASGILHFIKTISYFKRLEKKIEPQCVISTGAHGYWRPESRLVVGYNIPQYIYGDSPYFDSLPIKKKIYWWLRKRFDLYFYKKADAIIVQTDDVNNRLAKLIHDKPIFTVSNTVNAHYLNYEQKKMLLPPKEADELRLLTLSANYGHKNLTIIQKVIPELLKRSVKNVKFVLTLPPEVFETFKNKNIEPYLVNVGPVPIKDCPGLYQECDFMFLPTLLECFSASYVEAMVMNKPILTSNLPFAKTVCRDAAVYFDPQDSVNIAKTIIEVMNDEDLFEDLCEKGEQRFSEFLTAKERAKMFLDICNYNGTDQKNTHLSYSEC